MTSADRASSLATLQPLTTYDDECAYERRSQARRQGIKGGCSPSNPASFATKQSYLRTNEYLKRSSNEHILTRTALHLGSETQSYSCASSHCPEKYNQTTLFLPVHSLSSCTRSPRTHRASDDNVVCGPLSPLRGPGLHEVRVFEAEQTIIPKAKTPSPPPSSPTPLTLFYGSSLVQRILRLLYRTTLLYTLPGVSTG